MNPLLKVGVTGGIGSGKSTVCRLFGMLGVHVYDSDAKAKELMTTDSDLMDAIKEAFGAEVYRGAELNRALLAEKVFNNREALATLNSLVHPAVTRDFQRVASELEGAVAAYIIMESAIIFENNLQGDFDRTITVSAPEELRLARAMGRDGASQEKIEARMANQLTDAERELRADFVIRNAGRELVWEQVLCLHKVLSM
jgi:dephospho-CoA kinase